MTQANTITPSERPSLPLDERHALPDMAATDTKRCGFDTDDRATTFDANGVLCDADGAPCLVLEAIAHPLEALMAAHEMTPEPGSADVAAAMALSRPLLPCTMCQRRARADARQLARVRLGKHERRILLEAAPPEREQGQRLAPPAPGRAADEAHRRAIRTLAQAGLVHVGRDEHKTETAAATWWRAAQMRTYWHRVTWLSPLGVSVITHYRTQLLEGRPIRWGAHLLSLMHSGCADVPQLLAAFGDRLQQEIGWHETLLLMATMHGRGRQAAEAANSHTRILVILRHVSAAVTGRIDDARRRG